MRQIYTSKRRHGSDRRQPMPLPADARDADICTPIGWPADSGPVTTSRPARLAAAGSAPCRLSPWPC